MPRIVIHPGTPSAREFDLKPGPNSLGRGPANDITIEDASVSTVHCQIIVGDNQVMVQDLGSTNGTFLNDRQITQGELAPGQVFALGGVKALLSLDPAPAARAVATPVAVRLISQPPQGDASAVTAPTAGPSGRAPVTVRMVTKAAPVAAAVPAPAATPVVAPLAAPVAPAPAGPVASAVAAVIPPPPSRVVVGHHGCKFHPKTPGRHLCEKCNRYYCDLCVTTRHGEGGVHVSCRHCGGECVPVTQQIVHQEAPGFFGQLPGAFIYPLRGGGAMMILVGMFILAMLKVGQLMLFLGSLRLLICGIVLVIFTGGYFFAFLQNILQSTGAEDREIPELPGITNVLEDIVLPFGRFLGLNTLCFAPAIAVAVWAGMSKHPLGGQAIVVTLLLGGAYFPMAFLAVALHDSILVANPLLVIPSMFKVPLEYFVTLLAFGAFLGSQVLGDWVSKTAFPDSFSTESMPQLFLMIGVRLVWAFFNFYLIIVAIRILGTIFVSRKERLGWFQTQ
jgi:hypothetical protein